MCGACTFDFRLVLAGLRQLARVIGADDLRARLSESLEHQRGRAGRIGL